MKTRIITAIVGIIVLIGVMFTFNTLIFNLVIAAITLIAIHEIYNALGFTKKDWLMYAALVPYTLLVMTSNYMVMRRLVMPVSFVLDAKWEGWKRLGVLASEMESAALFTAAAALGVRCGSAFHVIWNQEREKAGLDQKESEDVTLSVKLAVEAVKELIRRDRAKEGRA